MISGYRRADRAQYRLLRQKRAGTVFADLLACRPRWPRITALRVPAPAEAS